jgi:hypothetical protein
MLEEKSEADIQAELRAKVACMPPDLVARYVPWIKAYERMVLRFHTELAALQAFDDADIERLDNAFEAAHPLPAGTQATEEQEEQKRDYIRAGLEAQFPGVQQQIHQLCQDYGDQLQELAKPFSIENFAADGGTQEQLNDLHQAVLAGIFSRPRAPQGPAPA